MVVAGLAKAQMTETFATAIEKKDLPAIESEPMCYLLSKLGYADDSIDILPFLKEGDSYRRGLRRFLGGFLLLTAYIAIHFTG
jgi:hypothetical protein